TLQRAAMSRGGGESFGRTRKSLAKDLSGSGKAELLKDLPLPCRELCRLDLLSRASVMNQQRVIRECTHERQGGGASLFGLCFGGDGLAVLALQEVIESEGQHHQKDQRFDALRRVQ